jgi:hypothetical protein
MDTSSLNLNVDKDIGIAGIATSVRMPAGDWDIAVNVSTARAFVLERMGFGGFE